MMSVINATRKLSLMMAILFSMGFAVSAAAGPMSTSTTPVTAGVHFAGGDEGGEVDCELQPNHPDCA